MSAHEYQDVTVYGVAPEGNRAGITPSHPDLAPFFAEGWRVNRHEWHDGGQCRVQLYREKAMPRLSEMLMALSPEAVAAEPVPPRRSSMHLTVDGGAYYVEAVHGLFSEQEARAAVEWCVMASQRGHHDIATEYRTEGAILAVKGYRSLTRADEEVIAALAKAEKQHERAARYVGARAVDLRSAAEKAQDDAHAVKLRGGLSPIEYRARWQAGEDMSKAGALDNFPPVTGALREPPAPPAVMAGEDVWDRWLLEFGAWLMAAPIEDATRERVADAAMVVAGAARDLAGLLTAIARPQVLPATADTWTGAAAARAIWESTNPDTGAPAIAGAVFTDAAARKAWGLA